MDRMSLKNLPIILGLISLTLAVPAAIYVSAQKRPLTLLTKAGKEKTAVFYLWPAEVHVPPEEEVAVKIILTTQEKTAAQARAKVKYDPEILLLKSLDRGVIFNKYADKIIDPDKGEAEITGQGSFSGTATFATLNFVPKKVGDSRIDLILTSSKVEDENKVNILQGVNGGILVVE